jgi:Domain of unknown function (DUF4294)
LHQICKRDSVPYNSRTYKFLATIAFVLFSAVNTYAQNGRGKYDTILVSGIIKGNDTFPFAWLPPVIAHGKMPAWLAEYYRNQKHKEQGSGTGFTAYMSLRNKVIKTFPYAHASGVVLQDLDSMMKVYYSNDAKKAFKERKEKELNQRFKGELTDMTISEGKVLIKLISRQTGKDVYTIVKELKGGGFAIASQGIARLFDHNLKDYYEPNGEDVAIEAIVRELEFNGFKEIKF